MAGNGKEGTLGNYTPSRAALGQGERRWQEGPFRSPNAHPGRAQEDWHLPSDLWVMCSLLPNDFIQGLSRTPSTFGDGDEIKGNTRSLDAHLIVDVIVLR